MVMTNLFSIFDPTLSVLCTSYLILPLSTLLVCSFYWVSNTTNLLMNKFLVMVKKEINYSSPEKIKGLESTLSGIFLVILTLNFLSLFPHLFSLTSHLMLTFPLSFTLWVGVIMFSWTKSFIDFLSHLVPTGTPLGLVSFMSLVELLSSFIRPMALTFRLTANMMAGHLLLSLIGGALLSIPLLMTMLMIPIQSLLMFMELGVSLIQAYVFTTLTLLYISETN